MNIQKQIKDFQQTHPHTCPRCGLPRLSAPIFTNALSRTVDCYICNPCGNEEAVLDWCGSPMPTNHWYAVAKEAV